jgi:hypothetical protein
MCPMMNGWMIMNQDTRKREDALTLFTESVLKPDVKLRQCARNQDCYDELMKIREDVLEYLKTLR